MNDTIRQLLGLGKDAHGKQKFIVAKDVMQALGEYVEKERFPAQIGVTLVDLCMGIEVISHEDMPDGEMLLVPYDMNADVAVEIHNARRKNNADDMAE